MKSLPAEISVMVSIYRVGRIRWRKGEGQVREMAVSRVRVGFLGRACDNFYHKGWFVPTPYVWGYVCVTWHNYNERY
jgi:hypothetical protein